MSLEARKEVERFLREGKKIAAIKHLQDTYGFTLSQSKMVVDAIEETGSAVPEESEPSYAGMKPDEVLIARVKALLAAGQKIEAIKLAKETLSVRLNGAKVFVEDIERELNPSYRIQHGKPLHAGAGGILLGVFIGLGLLFMGAATYVYLRQSQSIQQSDLIKGRVVSMRNNNEGMSAPVIEYEWHGEKRMYESSTYSNPPAFTVDEEVPVYVNRQDPGDITVDSFSERWLLIMILAVMGSFFVGIPMAIMYFTSSGRVRT